MAAHTNPSESHLRAGGFAWRWRPLPGELARPDFGVYVAADPEELLDRAVAAGGAEAPYFADLWPAGEALARHLLRGPALDHLQVLDLGAGVGVVALAAACRGARVTCLDRSAPAQEAVRLGAERLGLPPPLAVQGDWRTWRVPQRFDRIVAADVLYEPAFAEGVARCVAAHLADRAAELWLADPGRVHARAWAGAARAAGLAQREEILLDTAPGRVEVRLRRYSPAR